MTKAEKIFKDTKYSCKKHIEAWGFDNAGFTRMSTEEVVYQKTANEIKKIIEKEYKNILIDSELGIITEEEARKEAQIIKMVELTLENQNIA
jgi:hypothetical protein